MNTTEKEIAALKELVFIRLDAMDKAIKVSHEDLVRVPTEVQKSVGTLKELHEEKFSGIEKQFKERDIRTEQTAKDAKTAIDAALTEKEKAINKSEASITKQIDGVLLQISDLKERLTRIEGQSAGKYSFWNYIVGAAGVLAILVSMWISLKK